jgi:hypothetical protein
VNRTRIGCGDTSDAFAWRTATKIIETDTSKLSQNFPVRDFLGLMGNHP